MYSYMFGLYFVDIMKHSVLQCLSTLLLHPDLFCQHNLYKYSAYYYVTGNLYFVSGLIYFGNSTIINMLFSYSISGPPFFFYHTLLKKTY